MLFLDCFFESVISSLTENYGNIWNHFTYKTSKNALNMIMSCLDLEPKYTDLKVVLLDIGSEKN